MSVYAPSVNSQSDQDFDIDQLVAAAHVPKPPPKLLHANDLSKLPAKEWLIDGELPANELACLFGASEGGKSFLALSYALSMAQQHNVVYIAAEGASGYAERIKAWCIHQRMSTGNLYFWPQAVALLQESAVSEFVTEIAHLRPALIVVDTVAWCLVGGDENSSKDMMLFVTACERIRRETSATVLLVHHTGKSGDYRGSSALKGAMDVMIELKNDDGLITVSCAKMKDAPDFERRKLRLMPVQGTASCVLVPVEQIAPRHDNSLTTLERDILDTLNLPIFESTGARTKDVQSSIDKKYSDRALYRALSSLKVRALITQSAKGDPYYITDKGRDALAVEELTDSAI